MYRGGTLCIVHDLGARVVYRDFSCKQIDKHKNTKTENITFATALAGDKNPVKTLGFRLSRIACKLYLSKMYFTVSGFCTQIKLELNCNGIINRIVTVPERS